MANEITTTAYDDLTHASLVEPTMVGALAEQPGLWALCREFSAIGKSTSAVKIPKEVSFWGTPADDGAGVDTELNGTEAPTSATPRAPRRASPSPRPSTAWRWR